MAGIVHKIEEKLGFGGEHHKEGEKHDDHHHKEGEKHEDYHHKEGEKKHEEGLVDKIKDKIHGDGAHSENGEKKKKKEKKKKEHGGDSSSGSDSD